MDRKRGKELITKLNEKLDEELTYIEIAGFAYSFSGNIKTGDLIGMYNLELPDVDETFNDYLIRCEVTTDLENTSFSTFILLSEADAEKIVKGEWQNPHGM